MPLVAIIYGLFHPQATRFQFASTPQIRQQSNAKPQSGFVPGREAADLKAVIFRRRTAP
jgi:hypothetical protein